MKQNLKKETEFPLFNPDEVPFQQCHASTIVVLPNQDKYVAFFAGDKEGASNTAIWLVEERDAVWQRTRKIIDEPCHALWNPVLYAENNCIWLFYKSGINAQKWITKVSLSFDRAQSWSEPVPLVAGENIPRGPVKNKLIRLTNGDWIAPNSIERGRFWDAFVDRSSDKGQTWHLSAVPFKHQDSKITPASDTFWGGLKAGTLWETQSDKIFIWDGIIQPTLWESSPGAVHMLLRSTRGRIYRSDSVNFGRSWSVAYLTALPNNNSGLDLVVGRGRLFLLCNPVSGNWGARSPLSLLVSDDNGATWGDPIHIRTGKGEYSYPAVVYEHGMIHITYSDNRKRIFYERWTVG